MKGNRYFIALLIIVTAITYYFTILYRITKPPLMIWDEARAAVNALEMLSRHSFFTPTFRGQPETWSLKPPLLLWLQIIAFKIVGLNVLAVRLPSALATAGIIAFFFIGFHKILHNKIYAAVAALLFLTWGGFINIHMARYGDYDALLAFCLFSYLIFYFLYWHFEEKKYLYYTAFFFLAAILTKGSAGLVMLPPLFIFTLATGKARLWIRDYKAIILSLVIIALVVTTVYGIREYQAPGYWQLVVYGELFTLPFHPVEGHSGGFYFYYDLLLQNDFGNYISIWIISALWYLTQKNKNPLKFYFVLYILITTVSYWLLVSLIKTKLPWYSAPLYPLLAIPPAIGIVDLITLLVERWKMTSPWREIIFIVIITAIVISPLQKTIANNKAEELNGWNMQDYGRFMKKIKIHHPDIRKFTVFYKDSATQIVFFTEVMNKEGYHITLAGPQATAKKGDVLCSCESSINDSLYKHFSLQTIDSFKECRLMRLIEID